jgi:two-component system sensor histidine kinase MtrB
LPDSTVPLSMSDESKATPDRGGPYDIATFVSESSHDLKTPLAAISGYVATLLRRGDSIDPALQRDILQHVADASARLSEAIEQLVDLARLSLGQLDPTISAVRLAEAVEDAVSSVKGSHPEAEIEQVSDFEGDVAVLADRRWLLRALRTLIENGLRHGSGRVRIEVGAGAETGWVRVRDGGTGVPDELVPYLFSAELAGRPRQGQPRGLGIALHNAAAFMRLCGGSLELEEPRGKGKFGGATFRLSARRA